MAVIMVDVSNSEVNVLLAPLPVHLHSFRGFTPGFTRCTSNSSLPTVEKFKHSYKHVHQVLGKVRIR